MYTKNWQAKTNISCPENWNKKRIQTILLISIDFVLNNILFWKYNINTIDTMSWELWKHHNPVPGVRPIFLKPKLHKESKNGFKTINYRPSPVMIFSKNCYKCKKIIKKGDVLLILIFLWQYTFPILLSNDDDIVGENKGREKNILCFHHFLFCLSGSSFST